MIKAVVFDLDNTLIDFMGMKKICIDAAINAMNSSGLKMNKNEAKKKLFELYDLHGIEYHTIFQEFLKKVKGNVDYNILANGIVAYRKVQLAFLEPYPGVIPTLLSLKQKGLKIAILTDAPKLKAWLRLAEINLDAFFDVVVAHEDTGKYKPHPAPYKKIMSLLKVKPEECLMVGDWAERDIKGANKVGMKTCFAKYGDVFNTKISHANYEIDEIEQILSLI